MCILVIWGFLGGPGTDPEKSKTDSRAYNFQGWLRTRTRGHKGPSEAPSGRPKGPRHIDKIGFGRGPPQNVLFSAGNTTFFEKHQSAPGGASRGVLREFLGPWGGPGTPPGGRAVFQGGPRGPFGGPWEFRGGARGPRGTSNNQRRVFMVFSVPKGPPGNMLKPIGKHGFYT